MANITLGIGSNIAREENICSGLKILSKQFESVSLSPVYESRAVGFDGSNFFNMVMSLTSDMPLGELASFLRELEACHGRKKNAKKYSSRFLDVDILTYDNWVGNFDGIILPREEILLHAFVLKPLADVVPNLVHPVVGQSFATLWHNFNGAKDVIWQSDYQPK